MASSGASGGQVVALKNVFIFTFAFMKLEVLPPDGGDFERVCHLIARFLNFLGDASDARRPVVHDGGVALAVREDAMTR